MNTPRLLFMFGLFLPLTLICPPGNRMFTRKYSFWVSGFTWQSWLIPVSRSRGLLSPLLTDVVIGLLLNVTHYNCTCPLFYLMRLIELIIPSTRAIKENYTLLSKISFLKRLSRNQSTNYLCQYVGWGYADHPSPRLMYETYEKVYNGFSLPFPFL